MPLYLYMCSFCGKRFEVFKPLSQHGSPERHCDREAIKVITTPMIAPDYEGYVSPATGKWVEGKKAHIEDLKRSGCRVLEPGETDHYEKNWKKDREAAIEKAVETVFTETLKDIKG